MLNVTEHPAGAGEDLTTGLTTYSEVRYAGGVFTIDVDVCSALFDYALELARRGRWDSVTLPSLVAGLRVDLTLVLGPGSQIWCSPVQGVFVDIADEGMVADLHQRTDALHPRSTDVVYADSAFSASHHFDFDY